MYGSVCSTPNGLSLSIASSITMNRSPDSENVKVYLKGTGDARYGTVASRAAGGDPSVPFQSQSRTPPPSRIGAWMSKGVAARRDNAAIRLDLPEAFGPIKTFNGSSGKRARAGPEGEDVLQTNRLDESLAFHGLLPCVRQIPPAIEAGYRHACLRQRYPVV